MFSKTNRFRRFCNYVIHKWWFNGLIDCAIFVSCVFMALDTANNRGDHIFVITDYIFTSLFAVEMMLKMIALGNHICLFCFSLQI